MKQDYEFIKEILVATHNFADPVIETEELLELLPFPDNFTKVQKVKKLYLHIQLLSDSFCFTKAGHTTSSSNARRQIRDRHDLGFIVDEDFIICSPEKIRLTRNGYDLLTSLENSKVMDEVRKSGGKIAIESVIGIATSLGTATLTKLLEL